MSRQVPRVSWSCHGQPWPAMAGLGQPWPAMAGLSRPWPAMAGHGQPLYRPGRPWPIMAGCGKTWPDSLGGVCKHRKKRISHVAMIDANFFFFSYFFDEPAYMQFGSDVPEKHHMWCEYNGNQWRKVSVRLITLSAPRMFPSSCHCLCHPNHEGECDVPLRLALCRVVSPGRYHTLALIKTLGRLHAMSKAASAASAS